MILCQGHKNARMKKSALFKGNKDTKIIKNINIKIYLFTLFRLRESQKIFISVCTNC